MATGMCGTSFVLTVARFAAGAEMILERHAAAWVVGAELTPGQRRGCGVGWASLGIAAGRCCVRVGIELGGVFFEDLVRY